MATRVLAGSKAKYCGKNEAWIFRFGKHCTVMQDTCLESPSIEVQFEDETSSVLAYPSSLHFIPGQSNLEDY